MDIKHCIDARAALTLGKDMTFRDYAQGAFRMRGIGIGQTIEVLIIPEVLKLITDQATRLNIGKPSAVSAQFNNQISVQPPSHGNEVLSMYASDQKAATGNPLETIRSPTQLLIDISSWLTLNGMRSENTQYRLLCEQSMHNIWRKQAFNLMISSYHELTQEAFAHRSSEIRAICSSSTGNAQSELDNILGEGRKITIEDLPAIKHVLVNDASSPLDNIGISKLQRCLDVYREKIDFSILNNIPLPTPMSVKMRNEVNRHNEFLTRDNDRAVSEKIILDITSSENLSNKVVGNETKVTDDEVGMEQAIQREQVSQEEVLQEEEEVS